MSYCVYCFHYFYFGNLKNQVRYNNFCIGIGDHLGFKLTDSLLTTKLYIPPTRLELVPRPRLIKQLDEGLHRKLTLISAPAGFGKTTLVTDWLDKLQGDVKNETQAKNKIAWLSLDEGDNNPARFLSYFIAALNQIEGMGATFGKEALSMLQSPQKPPIEAILASLINEFAEFTDKFIFVLDDYHLIEAQPINDALIFLLEHLPPQIHLVIATREDPHLPLARLRSQDQLTELRVADLRFTSSEAAEFLNQMMGLTLSAEDITALETRTEGWIAGLQLAAISMRGQEDATNFIKSFTGSHRLVLDYLIEEVLEQQPENIQTFLLHTAVLDQMTASLCDALTGQDGGQQTLDKLERTNLFIVPLDWEREWYRYHHLFADLLRQQLRQAYPEQIPTLHSRASKWYEQNGFTAEAVEHSIRANDFERAAGLVELAWSAMRMNYIQSPIWLDWVKSLPDEMVRARPVLSVGYAWVLLDSGELEAAEARLRDADRWLDPSINMSVRSDTLSAEMVVVDEEQFQLLPVTIAAARAYHAQALGDVSGTVNHARRVLELLPEGDHRWRGEVTGLLGLAYWANGDLEAAHQAFTNVMAILQETGNTPDAIGVAYILADIRTAQGHLNKAANTYQQALQLAAGQAEPMSLEGADLYRGMSELHCERGELEAAAQHLLTSKKLGKQGELPNWQHRLCVTEARMKEVQGDLDGALALLEEAERKHIRTPSPVVRPTAALKTRVWVAQGRLAEALNWVRDQSLSVDGELSYLREFEHITLARVLIAQYKSVQKEGIIHETKGLLTRLLKDAKERGRMGSVIEILVLQALAHEAQRDISTALVSLERALTLAEPEGYVRIFVDEGPPMTHLLNEAQNREIAPEYVCQLLGTFPDAEPERANSVLRQAPESELFEPLSEREIDVLQLIAVGHKYQEIADRLVISLNTVRHHTKNLYRKLEVNNRTQAIKKANDLNLLQH